ncbi:aminodeoxychorismate synthase component I [Hornefia butyriciproducens]|uniref:aminodeoxychorismate synthase component I n=1 Tax=Hornefia butyriciproducens TaxID=2652293 RepID=UPI002A911C72|nr:aminodeoxychorismate synthase component I [Hornefia butyriciproducens]MDY5463097.1 aminodeoxychorismate synthase component I [Hornefia butyriciproducens]
MTTYVEKLDFYRPASEIFERYHQEPFAIFLDSSTPVASCCDSSQFADSSQTPSMPVAGRCSSSQYAGSSQAPSTPVAGRCSSSRQYERYSIIALEPYLILTETEGRCTENGAACPESLEQRLSRRLEKHREENPTHLPLIAGAFGYFSYDFCRKFENIHSRHPRTVQVPDAFFAFYDVLIIEDREERALYLAMREEAADFGARLTKYRSELRKPCFVPAPTAHKGLAPFSSAFTKASYQKAIRRLIEYIRAGDIYIANMTQQLRLSSSRDPYEVYRYLRTHHPAPFGGFLQGVDFQVVCASPERFVRIRGNRVETRPIKGTRKRGSTKQEDSMLREELRHSAKDRSELLMIVDLERNDLNHICEAGSVQVPEHFVIEDYSTVFHLVSTVIGRRRQDIEIPELLHSLFPGGSITGAPKIRAMEIIDELELERRNLYTGTLGYFSLDGNCDFNIMIRTGICHGNQWHLGVGGGITCESDPEAEYEETLQKAKAMREALWSGDGARGQAGTRRLSDGLGNDARGQADSDDARELSDGLGDDAHGQVEGLDSARKHADTGGGVDTDDDFVQEETV